MQAPGRVDHLPEGKFKSTAILAGVDLVGCLALQRQFGVFHKTLFLKRLVSELSGHRDRARQNLLGTTLI